MKKINTEKSIKRWKGVSFAALLLYIMVILIITQDRQPTFYTQIEAVPFWSYAKAFKRHDFYLFLQAVENIAFFCPFGFLLADVLEARYPRTAAEPKTMRKRAWTVILCSLAFTLLIESMQYLRRLGTSEIDDIIDNTMGGALGLVGYWIFRWLTEKLRPGSDAFRRGCTLACIIVFLGVSAGISAQYVATGTKVQEREFAFRIESVEEANGRLVFRGYTFRYDSTAETDYTIRLAVADGLNYIDCETETGLARPDVDEKYGGEGKWINCGFASVIDTAKLDPNTTYTVKLKGHGLFSVNTELYLLDGTLYNREPWVIDEPDLSGTDLQFLQDEGTLVVSEGADYMTVYLYDNALYLLAREKYDFAEEYDPEAYGHTWTELRIWSTHPELQPVETWEAEWGCDNLSFDFEEKEITDTLNCGGMIRVAKVELPQDYPISVIHLGYYADKNWRWSRYYRM